MIYQDIDKAKQALATLHAEKQAQKERLQLAAEAKRVLNQKLTYK